jgi:nucleotide-binding universal stress UspA family protein
MRNVPGVLVGIDGSGRSRHALEWAIGEAAVRHAPLTVLTVQQAVVGYSGNPVLYPGDEDLAEQGGFNRLLMGSVSTQVTHHAPCPVVVIPDENI